MLSYIVNSKIRLIIRTISLALIISFIAYDISWANPDCLQVELRTTRQDFSPAFAVKYMLDKAGGAISSLNASVSYGGTTAMFDSKTSLKNGSYRIPCVANGSPYSVIITKKGDVYCESEESKSITKPYVSSASASASTFRSSYLAGYYPEANLFPTVSYPAVSDSRPQVREYRDLVGPVIPAAVIANSRIFPQELQDLASNRGEPVPILPDIAFRAGCPDIFIERQSLGLDLRQQEASQKGSDPFSEARASLSGEIVEGQAGFEAVVSERLVSHLRELAREAALCRLHPGLCYAKGVAYKDGKGRPGGGIHAVIEDKRRPSVMSTPKGLYPAYDDIPFLRTYPPGSRSPYGIYATYLELETLLDKMRAEDDAFRSLMDYNHRFMNGDACDEAEVAEALGNLFKEEYVSSIEEGLYGRLGGLGLNRDEIGSVVETVFNSARIRFLTSAAFFEFQHEHDDDWDDVTAADIRAFMDGVGDMLAENGEDVRFWRGITDVSAGLLETRPDEYSPESGFAQLQSEPQTLFYKNIVIRLEELFPGKGGVIAEAALPDADVLASKMLLDATDTSGLSQTALVFLVQTMLAAKIGRASQDAMIANQLEVIDHDYGYTRARVRLPDGRIAPLAYVSPYVDTSMPITEYPVTALGWLAVDEAGHLGYEAASCEHVIPAQDSVEAVPQIYVPRADTPRAMLYGSLTGVGMPIDAVMDYLAVMQDLALHGIPSRHLYLAFQGSEDDPAFFAPGEEYLSQPYFNVVINEITTVRLRISNAFVELLPKMPLRDGGGINRDIREDMVEEARKIIEAEVEDRELAERALGTIKGLAEEYLSEWDSLSYWHSYKMTKRLPSDDDNETNRIIAHYYSMVAKFAEACDIAVQEAVVGQWLKKRRILERVPVILRPMQEEGEAASRKKAQEAARPRTDAGDMPSTLVLREGDAARLVDGYFGLLDFTREGLAFKFSLGDVDIYGSTGAMGETRHAYSYEQLARAGLFIGTMLVSPDHALRHGGEWVGASSSKDREKDDILSYKGFEKYKMMAEAMYGRMVSHHASYYAFDFRLLLLLLANEEAGLSRMAYDALDETRRLLIDKNVADAGTLKEAEAVMADVVKRVGFASHDELMAMSDILTLVPMPAQEVRDKVTEWLKAMPPLAGGRVVRGALERFIKEIDARGGRISLADLHRLLMEPIIYGRSDVKGPEDGTKRDGIFLDERAYSALITNLFSRLDAGGLRKVEAYLRDASRQVAEEDYTDPKRVVTELNGLIDTLKGLAEADMPKAPPSRGKSFEALARVQKAKPFDIGEAMSSAQGGIAGLLSGISSSLSPKDMPLLKKVKEVTERFVNERFRIYEFAEAMLVAEMSNTLECSELTDARGLSGEIDAFASSLGEDNPNMAASARLLASRLRAGNMATLADAERFLFTSVANARADDYMNAMMSALCDRCGLSRQNALSCVRELFGPVAFIAAYKRIRDIERSIRGKDMMPADEAVECVRAAAVMGEALFNLCDSHRSVETAFPYHRDDPAQPVAETVFDEDGRPVTMGERLSRLASSFGQEIDPVQAAASLYWQGTPFALLIPAEDGRYEFLEPEVSVSGLYSYPDFGPLQERHISDRAGLPLIIVCGSRYNAVPTIYNLNNYSYLRTELEDRLGRPVRTALLMIGPSPDEAGHMEARLYSERGEGEEVPLAELILDVGVELKGTNLAGWSRRVNGAVSEMAASGRKSGITELIDYFTGLILEDAAALFPNDSALRDDTVRVFRAAVAREFADAGISNVSILRDEALAKRVIKWVETIGRKVVSGSIVEYIFVDKTGGAGEEGRGLLCRAVSIGDERGGERPLIAPLRAVADADMAAEVIKIIMPEAEELPDETITALSAVAAAFAGYPREFFEAASPLIRALVDERTDPAVLSSLLDEMDKKRKWRDAARLTREYLNRLPQRDSISGAATEGDAAFSFAIAKLLWEGAERRHVLARLYEGERERCGSGDRFNRFDRASAERLYKLLRYEGDLLSNCYKNFWRRVNEYLAEKGCVSVPAPVDAPPTQSDVSPEESAVEEALLTVDRDLFIYAVCYALDTEAEPVRAQLWTRGELPESIVEAFIENEIGRMREEEALRMAERARAQTDAGGKGGKKAKKTKAAPARTRRPTETEREAARNALDERYRNLLADPAQEGYPLWALYQALTGLAEEHLPTAIDILLGSSDGIRGPDDVRALEVPAPLLDSLEEAAKRRAEAETRKRRRIDADDTAKRLEERMGDASYLIDEVFEVRFGLLLERVRGLQEDEGAYEAEVELRDELRQMREDLRQASSQETAQREMDNDKSQPRRRGMERDNRITILEKCLRLVDSVELQFGIAADMLREIRARGGNDLEAIREEMPELADRFNARFDIAEARIPLLEERMRELRGVLIERLNEAKRSALLKRVREEIPAMIDASSSRTDLIARVLPAVEALGKEAVELGVDESEIAALRAKYERRITHLCDEEVRRLIPPLMVTVDLDYAKSLNTEVAVANGSLGLASPAMKAFWEDLMGAKRRFAEENTLPIVAVADRILDERMQTMRSASTADELLSLRDDREAQRAYNLASAEKRIEFDSLYNSKSQEVASRTQERQKAKQVQNTRYFLAKAEQEKDNAKSRISKFDIARFAHTPIEDAAAAVAADRELLEDLLAVDQETRREFEARLISACPNREEEVERSIGDIGRATGAQELGEVVSRTRPMLAMVSSDAAGRFETTLAEAIETQLMALREKVRINFVPEDTAWARERIVELWGWAGEEVLARAIAIIEERKTVIVEARSLVNQAIHDLKEALTREEISAITGRVTQEDFDNARALLAVPYASALSEVRGRLPYVALLADLEEGAARPGADIQALMTQAEEEVYGRMPKTRVEASRAHFKKELDRETRRRTAITQVDALLETAERATTLVEARTAREAAKTHYSDMDADSVSAAAAGFDEYEKKAAEAEVEAITARLADLSSNERITRLEGLPTVEEVAEIEASTAEVITLVGHRTRRIFNITVARARLAASLLIILMAAAYCIKKKDFNDKIGEARKAISDVGAPSPLTADGIKIWQTHFEALRASVEEAEAVLTDISTRIDGAATAATALGVEPSATERLLISRLSDSQRGALASEISRLKEEKAAALAVAEEAPPEIEAPPEVEASPAAEAPPTVEAPPAEEPEEAEPPNAWLLDLLQPFNELTLNGSNELLHSRQRPLEQTGPSFNPLSEQGFYRSQVYLLSRAEAQQIVYMALSKLPADADRREIERAVALELYEWQIFMLLSEEDVGDALFRMLTRYDDPSRHKLAHDLRDASRLTEAASALFQLYPICEEGMNQAISDKIFLWDRIRQGGEKTSLVWFAEWMLILAAGGGRKEAKDAIMKIADLCKRHAQAGLVEDSVYFDAWLDTVKGAIASGDMTREELVASLDVVHDLTRSFGASILWTDPFAMVKECIAKERRENGEHDGTHTRILEALKKGLAGLRGNGTKIRAITWEPSSPKKLLWLDRGEGEEAFVLKLNTNRRFKQEVIDAIPASIQEALRGSERHSISGAAKNERPDASVEIRQEEPAVKKGSDPFLTDKEAIHPYYAAYDMKWMWACLTIGLAALVLAASYIFLTGRFDVWPVAGIGLYLLFGYTAYNYGKTGEEIAAIVMDWLGRRGKTQGDARKDRKMAFKVPIVDSSGEPHDRTLLRQIEKGPRRVRERIVRLKREAEDLRSDAVFSEEAVAYMSEGMGEKALSKGPLRTVIDEEIKWARAMRRRAALLEKRLKRLELKAGRLIREVLIHEWASITPWPWLNHFLGNAVRFPLTGTVLLYTAIFLINLDVPAKTFGEYEENRKRRLVYDDGAGEPARGLSVADKIAKNDEVGEEHRSISGSRAEEMGVFSNVAEIILAVTGARDGNRDKIAAANIMVRSDDKAQELLRSLFSREIREGILTVDDEEVWLKIVTTAGEDDADDNAKGLCQAIIDAMKERQSQFEEMVERSLISGTFMPEQENILRQDIEDFKLSFKRAAYEAIRSLGYRRALVELYGSIVYVPKIIGFRLSDISDIDMAVYFDGERTEGYRERFSQAFARTAARHGLAVEDIGDGSRRISNAKISLVCEHFSMEPRAKAKTTPWPYREYYGDIEMLRDPETSRHFITGLPAYQRSLVVSYAEAGDIKAFKRLAELALNIGRPDIAEEALWFYHSYIDKAIRGAHEVEADCLDLYEKLPPDSFDDRVIF